MVLELRDKLPGVVSRSVAEGAQIAQASSAVPRTARDDLVDALQSLGFRPAEISGVLRELRPTANEPIDELMRRALAMLATRN
jgi:Holliday junction resolvasome RuvABC DNA-binding subunit